MKRAISARVEEKILEDSKAVAKIENRSFNNLLETSLITYCKGKLPKKKQVATYMVKVSFEQLNNKFIKNEIS